MALRQIDRLLRPVNLGLRDFDEIACAQEVVKVLRDVDDDLLAHVGEVKAVNVARATRLGVGDLAQTAVVEVLLEGDGGRPPARSAGPAQSVSESVHAVERLMVVLIGVARRQGGKVLGARGLLLSIGLGDLRARDVLLRLLSQSDRERLLER